MVIYSPIRIMCRHVRGSSPPEVTAVTVSNFPTSCCLDLDIWSLHCIQILLFYYLTALCIISLPLDRAVWRIWSRDSNSPSDWPELSNAHGSPGLTRLEKDHDNDVHLCTSLGNTHCLSTLQTQTIGYGLSFDESLSSLQWYNIPHSQWHNQTAGRLHR